MPDIPEPVKVSPLIKFFRYAFLCAGILYGATKLKALKVIEDGRKEERERKKIEKEARLLEEKRAASERDIAAIVAIFKGNSEPDSIVSEQSNQSQTKAPAKEDIKEVKQIVHDENADTISDDMSTCTLEEVKQIVEKDKTAPSPTINTEFESVEQSKTDSVSPKEGSEHKEKGDIFSNVFNLTATEDKKSDKSQVKPDVRISSDDPGSKRDALEKNEDRQSEESGYFVETFSEKIPFVEPEARKEDFYNKDEE